MRSRKIPAREPVGDPFSGFVIGFQDKYFLTKQLPDQTQPIAEGTFMIRYGIRYLGKYHISIVPGLVALDYGAMLTGEEAFDFLLHKSNLHPRADVVGFRNDGTDEMVVVKALDLAVPLDVMVYENTSSITPIVSVDAFIGTEAHIPERLMKYLPQYETLQLWKAGHPND